MSEQNHPKAFTAGADMNDYEHAMLVVQWKDKRDEWHGIGEGWWDRIIANWQVREATRLGIPAVEVRYGHPRWPGAYSVQPWSARVRLDGEEGWPDTSEGRERAYEALKLMGALFENDEWRMVRLTRTRKTEPVSAPACETIDC
jgi:hypothetical protein